MLQSDIIRRANRFGRAAVRERLLSPQMVQKTKAVRFPHGMKIFEVQDKATGRGIYKCYEQKLVAANWDDATGANKLADKDTVEVEVLNLNETDPVGADYYEALALYDRMMAWRYNDDQHKLRWVGIPVGPVLRLVRIAETSFPHTQIGGAGNTLTCNLLLNNGMEAQEGPPEELGYHIEVMGRASPQNIAIYWDDEIQPILVGGYDYHFVFSRNGHWYFNEVFKLACVTNIDCQV